MTGGSPKAPPAWSFAALALVGGLVLCLRPAGEAPPMSTVAALPDRPAADGRPRPGTIVRPLSCTPLPDAPGKSLSTMLVEFPPGAFTGPHRHPGSVSAFVVSGAIRSQLAGGPAHVYAAGQTWFEPPRVLHAFAENASATEPATLLATFVADDGCRQLVIPEHAAGH